MLTTDPRRDRPRLLALVEHPGRFRVERSRFTRAHLDDVYQRVRAMIGTGADGRWHSQAPGLEAVSLHLRSTETELARRLHGRFGDAIEIRLGGARHPARFPPRLRPGSASTTELEGLVLTAEPDRREWSPGIDILGRSGCATRRQPAEAEHRRSGVLLGPDGTIVGAFSGAIAGVERIFSLSSGEEGPVSFIAGSDAVDPAAGAALPPGEYALVVSIRITVGGELGPLARLVVPPVAIELVANTSTRNVGGP